MIEVKNLSKIYRDGRGSFEALKDIHFTIRRGEIFGFVGLSGAGKTSLVRCVSALEKADSGEVIIDGVDLTKVKGKDLRQVRRKIGLVFQQFNLLMNSTVYENVAFPLVIAGKPKDYIHKKVTGLLEIVGLGDKKDSYPAKLSGGQKQRVGIARALAGDPSLVICDEATSALDPSTTKSILALIKDINRSLAMTFIVITHEMNVMKEICHRGAVLEKGRIIEMGNVIELFQNPQTSTAKNFFGWDAEMKGKGYKKALSAPGVVVKAAFAGETASRPVISHMIKKFDCDVSLLAGNIQEIGDTVVGRLVIQISGPEQAVRDSLDYLKNQGIIIEAIRSGLGLKEEKVYA